VRGESILKMEFNDITFEWDDNKNQTNIKKHDIDFETAIRIFADENRIDLYDEEHSAYEERYLTIGIVDTVTVLVTVSYTERDEALRIISARRATREERRMYNDR
jgi:hypothetical protein